MIGQRLKEERERLGFSQTEFAARAGAAKRTQIDWEKGASSPTAVQLALLADAGVDLLYVLLGSRPSHERAATGRGRATDVATLLEAGAIGPPEARLLQAFRSAPDKQATILEVVEALALEAGKAKRAKPRAPGGVVIHGDVGQHVAGDQNVHGSVSFSVGGDKKTGKT